MAQRNRTRGTCAYCGKRLTRTPMANHLARCEHRAEAVAAANRAGGRTAPLIHLQVQDAHGPEYWLQLEMNGRATLEKLDRYLRAIWLECCGHLSRFSAGGWRTDDIEMHERAADVLRPGAELLHQYDFGTTSETMVRVVGWRTGHPLTAKPILLMARNEPPEARCQECGAEATHFCVECLYEQRTGELCAGHAATHRCEYSEPVPMFNSPRAGACGYEGPAEPPY